MPRRKVFDKKTATTFSLVHRAQNDPLIHDEDAPSMVFAEKAPQPIKVDFDDARSTFSGTSYRSKKTNQREDMEDEFGLAVRANEGEAAQHGVFFDDTQYDYMQHMRDLGSGEGSSTWVEASNSADKQGKKQRLEDILRSMDLEDTRSVGASSTTGSVARSLLPEEVLPSEYERRRTYQDQQDVPDDIAGFQPDMDPRLREVLEALEDEEFVDDDEDIFAELTQDNYEVEKDEWDRLGEQQLFEEEEGWESDDTIKASSPPPPRSIPEGEQLVEPPEDAHAQPPADPTGSAWMDEFKKFKSSDKATKESKDNRPTPSALDASIMQSLASGRRKKRKGARTSTTNYSMTSSSLARTEPLRLLDARFEKTLEAYRLAEVPEDEDEEEENFDEGASATSGMTGLSKASKGSRYSKATGMSGVSRVSNYSLDPEAPKLIRSDFDSIMDEFLATHSRTGKHGRRVKRVGPQTGMEQLDEIRSQLGPARIKSMSKPS